MSDTSIAVTGAAGFIGSALVRRLNQLGYKNIFLIDYLEAFANTWNYSLKDIEYNRIFTPFQYLDFLKQDLNKNHPLFTFHMGAISNTQHPIVADYFKYNYDYTISLLDNLKELDENKDYFFVNASSSAVYGNGNGPLNAYAMSKKMIDSYITRNFDDLMAIKKHLVSFRFFNVYGFGEFHKHNMASMIYQLFLEYIRHHTLTIFEYGQQKRDFIYIDDLINNLLTVFPLVEPVNNTLSPVIDLGSGNSTSFNDIIEIIKMYFNDIHLKTTYKPMPLEIQKTYQVNTKAKVENYIPTLYYNIKSGIYAYYDILRHCDFYINAKYC